MIHRRNSLQIMATSLLAGVVPDVVAATGGRGVLSIIGTGEVGGCLGQRWSALGYRVVYGSRTPQDPKVQALAVATGNGAAAMEVAGCIASSDVILLAVPWRAIPEIAPLLAPAGPKVLIDISNPVKVVGGVFEVPDGAPPSVAEDLQARVPESAVVKAFNTLSVDAMADSAVAGGTISLPIAGADAEAKTKVARVAEAMGFTPIDVGQLYLARYLEGLARLRMTYRAQHNDAFEVFFRVHSV
jgi:predicted dinucleotide-binding enzyme